MTMGERIKELRKENGMTQTALAEALGITKGTVSTWETDTRTPEFTSAQDGYHHDIFYSSFFLLVDIFPKYTPASASSF